MNVKNEQKICTGSRLVSPVLLILVVLFVSCLIISNILANRMIQVWRWSLDAGTLLFPVTYVLSDVFSEVYGYKWSRRVTWMAASMNALFAIFVFISIRIPCPEWYDATPFKIALGSSYRIVIASLISYVAGDFVNDKVFRRMKISNPDMKGFKFRAILSSLAGESVDSTFFVFIAFSFAMPAVEMLPMICINILVKTLYELIILPVTCKITKIVKKEECKFFDASEVEVRR